MRLVYRQSLEPLRKLQRIHRAASLVEDDRIAQFWYRLHQARGLGAHDRPIIRALSTSLGRDLNDLNREEMLDAIEITVNDGAERSIGRRTGPKHSKFHCL